MTLHIRPYIKWLSILIFAAIFLASCSGREDAPVVESGPYYGFATVSEVTATEIFFRYSNPANGYVADLASRQSEIFASGGFHTGERVFMKFSINSLYEWPTPEYSGILLQALYHVDILPPEDSSPQDCAPAVCTSVDIMDTPTMTDGYLNILAGVPANVTAQFRCLRLKNGDTDGTYLYLDAATHEDKTAPATPVKITPLGINVSELPHPVILSIRTSDHDAPKIYEFK